MFSIGSSGSFRTTESHLRKMLNLDVRGILDKAGKAGVSALARNTPLDSGLASSSWTYELEYGPGSVKLVWHNTDIETGFPVALMLQYGYGTGTGGYVQGRDYINPAIEPIFQQIANDVRKAVSF